LNGILKIREARTIGAIAALVLILIVAAPSSSYAVDSPHSLVVEQTFTVSVAAAEDAFIYRLDPLEAGNPLPAGGMAPGYTFTISGNNSVEINLPNYSQPGFYRYELYQVIGQEKPGYTYDKRVYTIEAHVDAALKVILIARNKDGAKVSGIRFDNRYHTEPPAPEPPDEEIIPVQVLPSDPNLMADTPVVKTVSGDPSTNSTFLFKLAAQNAANPMPAGSAGGSKIIRITGSGRGEFGVWSYNQAGVYYYTVSELNTGEQGYVYDTAVYTITDKVMSDGKQLVVSRVVTNALNKRVTSFSFINKYEAGVLGPNAVVGEEVILDSGNPEDIDPDGGAIIDDSVVIEDDSWSIHIGNTPSGIWPYNLPKTGDVSNATRNIILFALGSILKFGATMYFIIKRKRRKALT